MKATFEISEKRLKALKELGFKPVEDKVEQWKPTRGNFTVYGDGAITDLISSDEYVERGMTRSTAEQAESLSVKLKTAALIDAFKCEFGTDGNWYIETNLLGVCTYDCINDAKYTEVVTMNRECAGLLAEKINNGTVIL